MKRFLIRHRVTFLIIGILLIWRIYLLVIETFRYLIPFRYGYLGFIPQGNFDGVFYLAISQYWYRGLDQAFFPLYPTLIWVISKVTSFSPAASAVTVSILSAFFLLLVLYKLMEIDHLKKYAFWSIVFYLSFPTSFFLAGIYTESVFILLILSSFFLARKEKRFLSSIIASIASATRVIGILILPSLVWEFYLQARSVKGKMDFKKMIYYFYPLALIPLGLAAYMGFLWYKYKDPLLFVHIQPAFGAGRSGGEIVFLPQLIYRYAKIFVTVSSGTLTFWISILEFTSLIIGLILLYFAYINKIRKSYILFALLAIIFPTLSGTLSSFPRYLLAAFPIFIFLGTIRNTTIKIILICLSLVIESILALLFYQGYFVS